VADRATELSPAIITRLPVRYTFNNRYSTTSRGPAGRRLHRVAEEDGRPPELEVRVNTDYFDVARPDPGQDADHLTGPLDKYFDYAAGELGWRSVELRTLWMRGDSGHARSL